MSTQNAPALSPLVAVLLSLVATGLGQIYCGRIVRGLVTNFHLPRSSLLMLVAGFAGRERVLAAYRHAVVQRYRFYSYGDAMLIV